MIKCKNNGCPENNIFCCSECKNEKECASACPSANKPSECEDAVFEGTELEMFQTKSAAILQTIADIVTRKKKLEEDEKTIKVKLQKAMEQHGIKSFANEIIKLTYIAATTANSIDSKILKEKYPEIASECSKTSNKSAYVKVEVK